MGKRFISAAQRQVLLDSYDKSKVSIKEYAAINGIGHSTLRRWLHNHKITLTTADNIVPVHAAAHKNPSDDQPITNRRCHSSQDNRSDAPIHFMDITASILHPTVPPEDCVAAVYPQESSDFVVTPASIHTATQKSVRTEASSPHNQLDVVLPNGIRLIFYQSSLDTSIALIKSLV